MILGILILYASWGLLILALVGWAYERGTRR